LAREESHFSHEIKDPREQSHLALKVGFANPPLAQQGITELLTRKSQPRMNRPKEFAGLFSGNKG